MLELDLLLPLVVPVLDLLPVPGRDRPFDIGAFGVLGDYAFQTQR